MKMKTQLLIELYDKKTENFIKEIDISHYNLEEINKICPPEDPLDIEYTDGIDLMEEQFILFKKYIKELKDIEYNDFYVTIITRRI